MSGKECVVLLVALSLQAGCAAGSGRVLNEAIEEIDKLRWSQVSLVSKLISKSALSEYYLELERN
jgi:hypothetical protein